MLGRTDTQKSGFVLFRNILVERPVLARSNRQYQQTVRFDHRTDGFKRRDARPPGRVGKDGVGQDQVERLLLVGQRCRQVVRDVQAAIDPGVRAEADGLIPGIATRDTSGIREVVHQTKHDAVAAAVVEDAGTLERSARDLHEMTPDLFDEGHAQRQQRHAGSTGPVALHVDWRHRRQHGGQAGVALVRDSMQYEGELVQTQAAQLTQAILRRTLFRAALRHLHDAFGMVHHVHRLAPASGKGRVPSSPEGCPL